MTLRRTDIAYGAVIICFHACTFLLWNICIENESKQPDKMDDCQVKVFNRYPIIHSHENLFPAICHAHECYRTYAFPLKSIVQYFTANHLIRLSSMRTNSIHETAPNFNFQLRKRYKLIWYHQFWFCFTAPLQPKMPFILYTPGICSLCAHSFDFCFLPRSDSLRSLFFCFVSVECEFCRCCLYEQHHSFFHCSLLRWHNGSDCPTVCQWYATKPAEGNLINNFIKHFCSHTICYATRNFHCTWYLCRGISVRPPNSLAWSVKAVISDIIVRKLNKSTALIHDFLSTFHIVAAAAVVVVPACRWFIYLLFAFATSVALV